MGLFGSKRRCGATGADPGGRPLACSYTLGDHEYMEAHGGGLAAGTSLREHLDGGRSRHWVVNPDTGDAIVTDSPAW